MVRYAAAVVCVATIFAGAESANAQYFGRNKVHYDRLEFRVLQTDHFDIYYYAEEEEATRHAARMAERWYARFAQLFQHTFSRRQPLVLYANHSEFAQTNITPGSPGEGTGGLTERTKARIALPFAAGLGATDHVLGHEIAHAFQIDLARRAGADAFALPPWFIEGMAEYVSLGSDNPETAMWVRDAAIHHRLPTIEQLNDPRYFPYRYGHALWTYLTRKYGDDILGRVLRSKQRNVAKRLEDATGRDVAQLTAAWHESLAADPKPQDPSVSLGRRIAGLAGDGARLHVSPALSPDGRALMFVSERDRLSLDLFMTDAASGAAVRKIVSMAADPHFDSLQYIHSAGAWDRSGRRVAISALREANPLLVIMDTVRPWQRTEIPLTGLGEIYNPSWSPDGTHLVFSALKGGLSDLFVYTIATGALRQLTADAFADLQPAWSPDGRTIAFVTDRFTSTLDDLRFGPLRIGLLDLETHLIRPVYVDPMVGKQVSVQWSPDGRAVYFISDREGVSNVYRAELASGELRRVTDVPGGVTGITSTSPALAVASQAGTLAFSVYDNGRYEIQTLDQSAALAGPVVPIDEPAVPDSRPSGVLDRLLTDLRIGLPNATTFPTKQYDNRLQLESFAPPFIGGVTGSGFSGALRATVGMSFADMLRDRQLQTMFRVGSDVQNMAAQFAYTNRKGQWNWGVAGGVVPSRFVGARRAIERVNDLITRETAHLRYSNQWGRLTAHYHVNRSQRIELSAGTRRTGFEWQTITRVIDAAERRTLSKSLEESAAGRAVVLTEAAAAFVHDSAVSGPTGPVSGKRLRLEIEPAFGGLAFADVRLDARRYFMPARPVTVAIRAEHIGRYGPDAGDARLTPLVLSLQSFVRGYDLRTFAADECGRTATTCSPLDELTGGRLALLNLEVRAPLLGLLSRDLYYGRLPIEAFAFVDAGFLWTRRGTAPTERDRFRSAGAGGRVNLGGIVFEVAAARPFDRGINGWTASLLLRPGW
jgi:hypothetical protein